MGGFRSNALLYVNLCWAFARFALGLDWLLGWQWFSPVATASEARTLLFSMPGSCFIFMGLIFLHHLDFDTHHTQFVRWACHFMAGRYTRHHKLDRPNLIRPQGRIKGGLLWSFWMTFHSCYRLFWVKMMLFPPKQGKLENVWSIRHGTKVDTS